MTSATIGHYTLGGVLGKGGFASVRSGTDTRTGDRVAIKVLERSALNPDDRIRQEIRAFRRLQHRGIVSYKDHFVTPLHTYIVMELVTGGEIYDKLAAKGKFMEDQARTYFRELVEAVEYCHSVGLCHRDLKLENLLVAADGSLKITDFGFSKSMKKNPKTVVGTALYVAPEVVLQEGSVYDGEAADTWSLGIILYLFAVGRFPFNRGHVGGVGPGMNTRQKDRFRTDNFRAPDHLSTDLEALLRRILCADPALRATIPEIKRSVWYTDGGRWQASSSPAKLPVDEASRDVSGEASGVASPTSGVAWEILDASSAEAALLGEQGHDAFDGFDSDDSDSDLDCDWDAVDVRAETIVETIARVL